MSKSRIKVGIVGLGNCASSLVQGIAFYSKSSTTQGLIFPDICGYRISDIEVVCAFDVNEKKIGKPIEEAIFAHPNCALIFEPSVSLPAIVCSGPVLDGISLRLGEVIATHKEQRSISDWKEYVVRHLIDAGTEIVVSYLPVGSKEATIFYADAAICAGAAFANAIPEFICSQAEWGERFRRAELPCAGDDIKSQLGATILHRSLLQLMHERGVTIDGTFQLNVGGNTDFLNMKDEDRVGSKRLSKTVAVTSIVDSYSFPTRIGPSEYAEHLEDRKVAVVEVSGRHFANQAIRVALRLEVEDSPNSSAAIVDVIRLLRVAIDRKAHGYQDFSSYYFKHPAHNMSDSSARQVVEEFMVIGADEHG